MHLPRLRRTAFKVACTHLPWMNRSRSDPSASGEVRDEPTTRIRDERADKHDTPPLRSMRGGGVENCSAVSFATEEWETSRRESGSSIGVSLNGRYCFRLLVLQAVALVVAGNFG